MIRITRTHPGPKILNGPYRTQEILDELGKVFRCKCYLCEGKKYAPGAFDIDHFIGQAEVHDNANQWENLYLVCRICNEIKPKKTYDGGYLDPCNPADNVETEIIYELNGSNSPQFLCNSEKIKTKNTVELLDRVHNGHNDKTKYFHFA